MRIPSRSYFEICKPERIEKELGKLVEKFNLQAVHEERRRLQWLDTFDWQLHSAGLALSYHSENDQNLLQLFRLDTGDILARQPAIAPPHFADDLADSRLRRLLPLTFPPRALISHVRQSETLQKWALLDEEKKTLARVEYHAIKPMVPGASPLPLLVLTTLQGYESEARPLFDWLITRKALDEIPFEDVFAHALDGSGRSPGDYSSKFSLQLDKSQTTDSALRDILLNLLPNIERNIPGTLDDTDSEFLHDLRVAVRRSRSALTRIKNVFPEAQLEHFTEELRWIGSITGACRDLDVYLLALPDMKAQLPEALQPHFKAFENYLRQRKFIEHQALKNALQSPRMSHFLNDWRNFLEAAPSAEELTETGAKPVQETAGAATWKMYRRVIRDGRELTQSSPAERFHELRKDMKKLRYLMELFASLYPNKQWKQQLKLQKVLQNILGDFQDLEVQADQMLDNGRALFERDDSTAETLMALGALSEQLREQQAHSLDHFEEAFAELAGDHCRDTFKKLCAQPGKGGKA